MSASAPPSSDDWIADIAFQARRLYADWAVGDLPRHLQRNSLDYYYLSVWPGLTTLDVAEPSGLPPRPRRTTYAYVHLPFCSGRCDFCSYFLAVSHEPRLSRRIDDYIDDLLLDATLQRRHTVLDVSYVYVGGGTPSLLRPEQLERLFDGLARLGVLSRQLVGTVELHPELFRASDRADRFLTAMTRHNLRRVSVGFQSADETLLSSTHRRHDADFIADAIARLRSHRLLINLDLMYGLPGQTLESWIRTIRAALDQHPDSISTYFTFVDPGTKMWRDVAAGRVDLLDHQLIQTQHIAAQIALGAAGYSELPNDFYSTDTPPSAGYRQEVLPSDGNSVSLGAGAYGYYPGVQYFNEFSFGGYSAKVRAGELPLWRAAGLTAREELARDIMFSLKNAPELRLTLFGRKHGITPLESHGQLFTELASLDLVSLTPDAVRLTPKGRLVVEEISCLFQIARGVVPASPAERRLAEKHHFAPTYSAATGAA